MPFTHLHVHSEYSLLDGLSRIEALVQRAKALGMEAMALTDHGALHAAIDFYLAAQSAGIKPIIGCEMYIAPRSRYDKQGQPDSSPYHLVLLARDLTGYRNLIQLATKAHLEGFYYKPRIDRELLAQHHQGLVALTSCATGEVPRRLASGDREGAVKAALWLKEVFGPGNFYLELQEHGIPEMVAVNREMVALGRELEIPLAATNDVHYVDRADAYAHDILLCIQTNTTLEDPKRMRMPNDSFYLKSPQEMEALFAELPEALRHTQVIAEGCDLKLEFHRRHLPEFPVPEGHTPDSYLEKQCWEGVRRRYGQLTSEIEERLRYELEVIRKTGFARYILIVADIVAHARQKEIPFGPRGSAAGSIVCYALGISDIDPIASDLVFERFLNIERQEMPDIDLDFADDRRGEMIEYVTSRYGRDRVAQIITFGTLGARAAIRDVGRALAYPYGLVDRVAKLVPSLPVGITIGRALEDNPELRELYSNDEAIQRLIDTARRLEGIARHASTHAAGVVISADPLTEHIPLQRATSGDEIITQYHMNALAQLGLLKMDFLGLANLTILGRAVEIIRRTRGQEIDLQRLPLDDPKTFAMLGEGETTGLFQLEGAMMRRYVKELQPTSVGDLAAMVALYRPGPMAHIPKFIRAKHGLEPIKYPHPGLETILKQTYGVIVYQEQVLQIVQAVAGYSLGQADVLRKAMGKKDKAIMAQERSRFVAGAKKRGFSQEEATSIFDLIEPFAGYAFNAAHAQCYGLLAYQTAYLKANYPVEYMTAVLSAAMGNLDKVAVAVAECRRLGIPVLPPDINHSQVGFAIEGQAIRFGLGAIKNVGEGAVAGLIADRESHGPFESLDDFCRRADVKSMNRRVLESLIKAGALDSFGPRSQLLAVVDRMIGLSQAAQRAKAMGQVSLFDFLPSDQGLAALALPDIPEAPRKERLAWERQLLGTYMTEHPLQQRARDLAEVVTAYSDQLGEDLVGQRVIVAGLLQNPRRLLTKKREAMLAAQLEDLRGSIEIVAFPKVYERTRQVWQEEALLVVQGRVDAKGDRLQVICEAATPYEAHAPAKFATQEKRPAVEALETATEPEASAPELEPPLTAPPQRIENASLPEKAPSLPPALAKTRYRLRLHFMRSPDELADLERLRQLQALLEAHHGPDQVDLTIAPNGQERVDLELEVRVRYSLRLHRQLAALLGEERVVVEKLPEQ